MKTNAEKLQADFGNGAARLVPVQNPKLKTRNRPAFTLIELLVVISIIAILAAFIVPVISGIKRQAYLNKTKAEMAQLETAIDRYKAAYGFYPPSNPAYPATPAGAMFSSLYFELLGTTNSNPAKPGSGTYYTLDSSASIAADATGLTMTPVPGPLGVSGFVNCSKGSGEDATAAKNFLPDLKPGQIGANITNSAYLNVGVTLLLGSAGGPDASYKPLGPASVSGVNPWRYVNPGINNPSSYDLWIQLVIKPGQTNLICNWTKQVQINSPLP